MEVTESTIDINASRQTVWSVIDDIAAYPEWNPIVPRLEGRTTPGQVVSGELVIPDMPTPPLTPTIIKVVPGREFRWKSIIPGDEGFSAEHIFIFEDIGNGTRLVHREIFDGPAAPHLADPIRLLVHPAYVNFDKALKDRAEMLAKKPVDLHPAISRQGSKGVGGKLRCLCDNDAVEIAITDTVHHNHLCGCSKCWKPQDAIFAMTAVVAFDAATIEKNGQKMKIVDPEQSIARHACSECGTHMLGTVSDPDHHFYGLTFVHPELLEDGAVPAIEFAGFVSSLVEAGLPAAQIESVRQSLESERIPAFDAFSPEIMTFIAYHQRKLSSTTSHLSEEWSSK